MKNLFIYCLRRSIGWLFVPFYALAVRVRHLLYDWGIFKSERADRPTLCIGNLTVGGTGKTPHTEFFIKSLSQWYRVGVVSRGYKRQSRGVVVADANTRAEDIGDEPYQIWMKYKEKISGLSVGSRRIEAIRALLVQHPDTEIVILDDAFQHRALEATAYVLLCDYYRPFYRDFMLPAGDLRDLRSRARQADIVIVSKCPADISEREQREIEKQIRRYTGDKPVFFSTYAYGSVKAVWQGSPPCKSEVVLLSGIATPSLFEKAAASCGFKIKEHLAFADHHNYNDHTLQSVLRSLQKHQGASLLTTEKDFAKIKNMPLWQKQLKDSGCYYLPLQVKWLGASPIQPVLQLLQPA
ncbi:tetraacyldisaccharide 4'-kinase [Thermonema lapsum]|uniref:Tetraacyldisaccharide 4'-kinase n=1 Tax=Thermonema lapsum TaxID=28195 RepID=A0A846MNX3_9BACT|nr:tetraacyldisaccharide 4'-kinase [Thermonema lapsum]NIK73169.1 tetraacyldisaccharide 4'-kinase [Thermonema lapsum]